MNQKSTRGVQQHEVDAAADALVAERLRPTIERVRMKIGRGSPNTVGPMLEVWFATLAPRLGVGPAAEENGAPAAVRQVLETVWHAALSASKDEANATLTGERESLASEREALEIARQDLARHEAALAERAAALEQALELAKSQLREQTERLAQLKTELEQAGQELVHTRESVAGLVKERDADRRSFADQQRAHAEERQRAEDRAAGTERRLLEEVDRARQETKQAKAAHADAQRQLEDLRASHGALQEQLNGAATEVALLRERVVSSERRQADLQHLLEEQQLATSAAIAQLASAPPGTRAARGRRPRAQLKSKAAST